MIKNIIALGFVLIGFVTLCYLGNWQLNRATWKNGIIAQLETQYAKDPMQYPLSFSALQDTAIQQGHIRGRFDYKKQILVGPKTYESAIGYDLLIPMALKGGSNVLVNMGWVKGEKRDDIVTPSPRGTIIVTGISRAPDWNRFTPNNSAENNIWTKLDINQIAKAKNIGKIAPVIFYAKTASPEFKGLSMMKENWMPRNKHMQYASFWFSMAGILLIFVALYIANNRRKRKS